MKHALLVLAVVAVLGGGLVLLPLLAWASLQDPKLDGARYYAAVLATLFEGRVTWATLAGAGVVVVGLAAFLYAAFLAGADRHERERALPAFWAVLGVCVVGMLALLVGVNYLRS
jgi:hypothetical protein